MPKSKGRKPKPAQSGVRRRGRSSRYDPGQLGVPPQLIANMLAAAPPDQLVEMLPPLLWLHHSTGARANLCVSAAMTLRSTYALLGIEARPTPVDLLIGHRAGGLLAHYGGSHYWDGENYSGHCVLWLPGSGRWIDTTVMQYPEVRASMPLPVVGRSAGTFGGNAASHAALAQGKLIPGTRMRVPREELVLDYTVVADVDNALVGGIHALAVDAEQRFRISGANLAAACLEWWRSRLHLSNRRGPRRFWPQASSWPASPTTIPWWGAAPTQYRPSST